MGRNHQGPVCSWEAGYEREGAELEDAADGAGAPPLILALGRPVGIGQTMTTQAVIVGTAEGRL
jgi:hypothetical protein